MQQTTRLKRLQHTLMLAFLVLSITPLILSALFFLNSHTKDLSEQSTNHLASLLDNKKKQLNNFFASRESEVQSFARSELANASGGRFYGLVGAYHQLGDISEVLRNTGRSRYYTETLINKSAGEQDTGNYIGHERYRLMYKRYNWAYEEYLKRSSFSDILLVDISGNIVYAANSPDIFGINLPQSAQTYPALSQTFSAIQKKTERSEGETDQVPVTFTDFSQSQGEADLAAWFAAPIIQQGYLHSYVFFKLSNQSIRDFLSDTGNNSYSVQTLLVGQDHRSRLPTSSNDPASFSSSSINRALEGDSGVGSFANFNGVPVLSAFAPLTIMDSPWALVVELPEEEAFARIRQLEVIFFVAMLTAIVLVIIASHWLSNSITAPLLRLTWAAEQVSAGDMDQKIEGIERCDEIGRLAISFARMQSSVREKMTLIREQNNELEQSIQIIQQKNKELQTADKLKDEFLATTSHELRTPLHGMVGIAESLLAGANGPVQHSQRRQLEVMINSGQRLTNLVDDLLDYHKMRYGDLDIQKQAVDVASAARLVLELSGHLLGSKPVRIINQIPNDLPLVQGDEQRLEQVLYNLVGNAIKYTSEGKIILSATILESQLRIQVVDTGQGIPAEQLEYIFEPLIQANTQSANYRQGSGLGLSISRQLIELMGGRLYVSSQPMIGTTFSFTLNLASDADIASSELSNRSNHFQIPSVEAQAYELEHIEENPDGELLLIVDDEPVNLQVLHNFLRLEGYRVITAESGLQALKLVESHQPALMLLDIMMPEMSGYEVCEQLRQRYNMLDLPIIMLSALGQVQDRIRGFESGANDYLTKPFNKEELTARIGAHLKAGQTERQLKENQRLAEEIERREQVENSLLETQNRLLGLLESSNEAILCVQGGGRIRYANAAAGKLFNRSPEQVERHHIEDILATHLPQDISQSHHFHGSLMFRIGDSLQSLDTDVINLPEESGLQRMFIFDNQGQTSSHRIEVLENAVEVLSGFAFNRNKESLQKLRHLGDEFCSLADKLEGNSKSKSDTLRELLVDIMKATLKHWEESTQKTKFELAEESGLWRVYLDRSTLQTRTLDKYLHLETLPKTPRWRTVLSTIDFVLERSPCSTSAHSELLAMKEQLQHIINQ
ncbi:sensory box sensor histidine kinase/response regulator [Photobacterium gaetbulicola Gung47]|uniref:histidine kinase n=1 Tax=Photobacterium gaetbulicola Gung47 TaxID=658445 RepID=A0A0C5X3E7_9GAMM|nr:response regulator [Photobacterium gaetbulicola]AJR09910.1 sensory box sensor histidine kinase/response regulator [Photobacterium gaetbulicola Gung47]